MENALLKENLECIRENIKTSAAKSGRSPDDITLVAVTKTVDVSLVQDIVELGVSDIGENKVQELLKKDELLKTKPNWHLIGHLQTNKVKQIIEHVSLIQSVDSQRLAEEINKRAAAIGKIADVLIEINIAGEDTKFGINPEDTASFIEHLCSLTNICLRGLMCMAPLVNNPDDNMFHFDKMFGLYIDIKEKYKHNANITYLSMGTTLDYEAAIRQGSNMVRIGTALFGERAYAV